MRRDETYLGNGFEPLKFWLFNVLIIFAWVSLKLLGLFAAIGVGTILLTGTTEVSASPLGMLGGSFVNMLYGSSVLCLMMLIVSTWLLGNIYLCRKEIHDAMIKYFRWGDL